jgi:hypothetical protein
MPNNKPKYKRWIEIYAETSIYAKLKINISTKRKYEECIDIYEKKTVNKKYTP